MEKQKTGKVLLFVSILVILVLAWVGSFWLKYKHWPWVDLKQAIEKAKNQQAENGQETKVEKSEEEIKSDLFRQGTMKDLAAKIGELSPAKPVLGGKWFVDRFWFVDDRNVYIEYEAVGFLPSAEEDGHHLRRILVNIEGAEENPQYKVIAYFEPGENDWVLKTGQDIILGKQLRLYEYDESKGEWVKKN